MTEAVEADYRRMDRLQLVRDAPAARRSRLRPPASTRQWPLHTSRAARLCLRERLRAVRASSRPGRSSSPSSNGNGTMPRSAVKTSGPSSSMASSTESPTHRECDSIGVGPGSTDHLYNTGYACPDTAQRILKRRKATLAGASSLPDGEEAKPPSGEADPIVGRRAGQRGPAAPGTRWDPAVLAPALSSQQTPRTPTSTPTMTTASHHRRQLAINPDCRPPPSLPQPPQARRASRDHSDDHARHTEPTQPVETRRRDPGPHHVWNHVPSTQRTDLQHFHALLHLHPLSPVRKFRKRRRSTSIDPPRTAASPVQPRTPPAGHVAGAQES